MNYLAHLFLSDPTPQCLLGNLMGDFVKGHLDNAYSPEIRRGIELHRKVDTFAQTNKEVRRSKSRFDQTYRHHKGILVDVFYDHFLAKNWDRYSAIPLADFARQVYQALEDYYTLLPEELRRIAPRMIAKNWLECYRDVRTIEIVLQRISERLTRPNRLGEGITELKNNYAELEDDFTSFLPAAVAYVQRLKSHSAHHLGNSS
jgi:acyl carrier protein phosphodiesterase